VQGFAEVLAVSLHWQTMLADGAHLYLLLENKRLVLRYGRLGFIIEALPKTTCIF